MRCCRTRPQVRLSLSRSLSRSLNRKRSHITTSSRNTIISTHPNMQTSIGISNTPISIPAMLATHIRTIIKSLSIISTNATRNTTHHTHNIPTTRIPLNMHRAAAHPHGTRRRRRLGRIRRPSTTPCTASTRGRRRAERIHRIHSCIYDNDLL